MFPRGSYLLRRRQKRTLKRKGRKVAQSKKGKLCDTLRPLRFKNFSGPVLAAVFRIESLV
jgi:hypothetical protein